MELQRLLDAVVEKSEPFGLNLNVKKTKVMVFSKKHNPAVIMVKDEVVEQVPVFKYLGTLADENCDTKREVRSRIEQARTAFIAMKKFFVTTEISLELRLRMVQCYVLSILLYGCEAWTLNRAVEKKIDAFEMYIYRKLLKISWTEKVTNVAVLQRIGREKVILDMIKERKLGYLGHVTRGDRYALLKLVLEGKIRGKRSPGRRQNSWMSDLRRWLGRSSTEIFRAAVSRVTMALWIANLRVSASA
jgi:hypothetical protein